VTLKIISYLYEAVKEMCFESFLLKFSCFFVVRSTPKSRPNNMGQMYVRPQKVFSDFDEIWYVGRGR